MTTKSEFNADEWERVAQAPALAGLMVALADRGGTIRESLALGKAYAAARRDEGGSELLEQIASGAACPIRSGARGGAPRSVPRADP